MDDDTVGAAKRVRVMFSRPPTCEKPAKSRRTAKKNRVKIPPPRKNPAPTRGTAANWLYFTPEESQAVRNFDVTVCVTPYTIDNLVVDSTFELQVNKNPISLQLFEGKVKKPFMLLVKIYCWLTASGKVRNGAELVSQSIFDTACEEAYTQVTATQKKLRKNASALSATVCFYANVESSSRAEKVLVEMDVSYKPGKSATVKMDVQVPQLGKGCVVTMYSQGRFNFFVKANSSMADLEQMQQIVIEYLQSIALPIAKKYRSRKVSNLCASCQIVPQTIHPATNEAIELAVDIGRMSQDTTYEVQYTPEITGMQHRALLHLPPETILSGVKSACSTGVAMINETGAFQIWGAKSIERVDLGKETGKFMVAKYFSYRKYRSIGNKMGLAKFSATADLCLQPNAAGTEESAATNETQDLRVGDCASDDFSRLFEGLDA